MHGNGHNGCRSDDELLSSAEEVNEALDAVDARPWPNLDQGLGNVLNVAAGWMAFGPFLYFVGWWLGWL